MLGSQRRAFFCLGKVENKVEGNVDCLAAETKVIRRTNGVPYIQPAADRRVGEGGASANLRVDIGSVVFPAPPRFPAVRVDAHKSSPI